MHTHVIPLLATDILEAGVLAAIPIVAIGLGTRIINSVQDARLRWTPKIELAAFATGALAGAVVFFNNATPGLLGPTAVFEVGGPWDMTFGEFIARAANPFEYDFAGLLTPVGIVLFLIAVAVAIAPIVRFGSPASFANGLRNAFLTVAGAYSGIYGLAYCLWLLNRLNFWVFLLLMILVHMRSKTNKVVFKVN